MNNVEYQFTEAVADFYGELEDYMLVRVIDGSGNNKVQLRRVIKNEPDHK